MQKRTRKLALTEPRLQPDEIAAPVSPLRAPKSPSLQIKVTGPGLKTSRSTTSVGSAAQPGKKPKARFDPISTVRTRYVNCGWTVLTPPRGSVNDLIAQRDSRFHFIQVHTCGDTQPSSAVNAFIQNAFSNGAVPIVASVRSRSCDMPDGSPGFIAEIDLRDVNRDSRVIISAVSRADTQ